MSELTIECGCCKVDTIKMKVIVRKPLKEIPIKSYDDEYREFYCINTIKIKRIWKRIKRYKGTSRTKNSYMWIEEECGNHILVKKIVKKTLKEYEETIRPFAKKKLKRRNNFDI